jgi:hypothetical protein
MCSLPAEAAALLGESTASINSTLQRARETLPKHYSSPGCDYSTAYPIARALSITRASLVTIVTN